MAYLERCACGTRVTLGQQCLVGRGKCSALQLSHAAVSGAHAQLVWSHGEWVLRDLASRNGTLIYPSADSTEGVLIHTKSTDAAVSQPLRQGAVIEFGGPEERWCLADASAPAARARRADGEVVIAEDARLVIPRANAAAYIVRRGAAGQWRLHGHGRVRTITDQEIVCLDGADWRMELPAGIVALDTTAVVLPDKQAATAWALGEVTLSIRVSHDGDDIDAMFEAGGRSLELEGYVFNELLLSLAHRFLEDSRTHPSRNASEHGWMDIVELLRLPSVDGDRRRLAQLVFQIRKHLGRAELAGYRDIIEQRNDKRRIGLQQLKVTFL